MGFEFDSSKDKVLTHSLNWEVGRMVEEFNRYY